MNKDYNRMPRVLSIITGIGFLLPVIGQLLSITSEIADLFSQFFNYSISFENPMWAYRFYETVALAFTVFFLLLTATMLLRGKKDLLTGIAFCATAIFWALCPVYYALVTYPISLELGTGSKEHLIFSFCSMGLRAVIWLIPALVCLTKNKFKNPLIPMIFLVLVYLVYNCVFNLSLTIDGLIARHSSSAVPPSIFELIEANPMILLDLSATTLGYFLGLLPFGLFAVTVSLPGKAKKPKAAPVKKAVPAYVPQAPAKPAPVKKPMPTYAPPAPAKPAPVKKPMPTYAPPAPAKPAPAKTPVPAKPSALEQQLRELKNLREQELISQEEYEAKKKQLLNL